jgi:hypothetical protein
MSQYYTVAQANKALSRVRPLASAMMRAHNEIVALSDEIEGVLEKSRFDSGSPAASRIVLLFSQFETIMKALQTLGVQVKDPGTGLCDFPARHNGRDILLCWKVGEAHVEWWHDLTTGFKGRRHVRELQL